MSRPSASGLRQLRARVARSHARGLAHAGVGVLNAVELAAQRIRDETSGRMEPLPPGSLTALVKTFERPSALRRLVASIRRLQPELPIIVVDDSRKPEPIDGVTTRIMPFNTGASAGRNAGLELVDTPYFVVLDDDFVLYRFTRLANPVRYLDENETVHIVGGVVVNLPEIRVHDYSSAPLYSWAPPPRYEVGSLLGGLPVRAKVPQFFVGRTEAVRDIGWMAELKTMEHREFFSRASGQLVTVQDSGLKILHARNPFDRSSPERGANRQQARAALGRRYLHSQD